MINIIYNLFTYHLSRIPIQPCVGTSKLEAKN